MYGNEIQNVKYISPPSFIQNRLPRPRRARASLLFLARSSLFWPRSGFFAVLGPPPAGFSSVKMRGPALAATRFARQLPAPPPPRLLLLVGFTSFSCRISTRTQNLRPSPQNRSCTMIFEANLSFRKTSTRLQNHFSFLTRQLHRLGFAKYVNSYAWNQDCRKRAKPVAGFAQLAASPIMAAQPLFRFAQLAASPLCAAGRFPPLAAQPSGWFHFDFLPDFHPNSKLATVASKWVLHNDF